MSKALAATPATNGEIRTIAIKLLTGLKTGVARAITSKERIQLARSAGGFVARHMIEVWNGRGGEKIRTKFVEELAPMTTPTTQRVAVPRQLPKPDLRVTVSPSPSPKSDSGASELPRQLFGNAAGKALLKKLNAEAAERHRKPYLDRAAVYQPEPQKAAQIPALLHGNQEGKRKLKELNLETANRIRRWHAQQCNCKCCRARR